MTNAKQLFSLQELDLVLDRIREDTDNAERELGSSLGLEHLEAALSEAQVKLQQAQSRQQEQRLETESQRERSTRLDGQLYGGTITNPRDLESLEQEAAHARDLLKLQGDESLDLAGQTDAAQTNQAALENELAETNSAWQLRQSELQNDIARWTAEKDTLAAQREDLAATLDPASIQKYEGLRLAKKGLAVAKVERGLCQVCRMSLPTQQQQNVRNGRQTVLCNSCGRILVLS